MAFLLLPVTWLSWGVAYPVTGIALGGFDVLTLRVLVQALGAAALAGQGTMSGISFKVEREAWPDLVITALLYMTIMPLCMTLGMYLMSPGRTSMLIYTMPIWASLFARPLLGERLYGAAPHRADAWRRRGREHGVAGSVELAQRATRRGAGASRCDGFRPRHGVA